MFSSCTGSIRGSAGAAKRAMNRRNRNGLRGLGGHDRANTVKRESHQGVGSLQEIFVFGGRFLRRNLVDELDVVLAEAG
jgi:hypothetical protein